MTYGDTRWYFENGLAKSIKANKLFFCNYGLFFSISLHLDIFSFYIIPLLNIITPVLPPCCLINHLPLLSAGHSFTLFSCCSFSLRHPLCRAPSRGPQSLSQIKSWTLSPPFSLQEVCKEGGGTGEMDLPSLPLCCGGCSGDSSELTSISISRTDAPLPTHHPGSRFTACYFSRWRKKTGRQHKQRSRSRMENKCNENDLTLL